MQNISIKLLCFDDAGIDTKNFDRFQVLHAKGAAYSSFQASMFGSWHRERKDYGPDAAITVLSEHPRRKP